MRNLFIGICIGSLLVSAIAAVTPTSIIPSVLTASPPDGYMELLTDQERLSLDAWMAQFRGASGALARCNDNDVEPVNTEYVGTISVILAKLDNDDVIPNNSGLIGAEPMLKSEVVTIVSYMQAVLAYNSATHRQNLARACGEANID
jgi:hypothetical protein